MHNIVARGRYLWMFPKEIIKYYNICHTFDIVDAAEKMMGSIDDDNSHIEEKASKILRDLMRASVK